MAPSRRGRDPAQGEDDLADRLRPAGADLAEADLPVGHERDPDAQTTQLVGGQGRARGSRSRSRPPGSTARRVTEPTTIEASVASRTGSMSPGRRGVGDVAAERAPVLDLGRPDRRGRLDQGRQQSSRQTAERRIVRVRRQGPERERVAVEGDPAQLVEPPQVEQPLRRLAQLAA